MRTQIPVGDPIWASIGGDEPIDIVVSNDKRCAHGASADARCDRVAKRHSNYCEVHQLNHTGDPLIVDIDKEWMDSRPHGVLTVPLQVTGQWKLMARVWVATRLLYMAARLLNYGVKVDGPAESA